MSVCGSVSTTNLFLLLSCGYLCLLLQFVFNKQMSPNLHGLHSIRCRVVSRDGQWAGQQQLSRDHWLQKEGKRRGGLEDVVRNHTCVVYNHTHRHTQHKSALKTTDEFFLTHTHQHPHTYGPEPPAVDLCAGSTCSSRNRSRLWKREKHGYSFVLHRGDLGVVWCSTNCQASLKWTSRKVGKIK